MPVPSVLLPPLDSLPSLVKSTFESAVEKEQVSIFEAASSSTHAGTGAFEHVVFVCPELDEKPGAPHKTPDLSSPKDKDPFEGPSFPEGQSIADLGDHVALTNTNAMRDEHFMIASKGFRPQAGELIEKDLAITYEIISAFKKQGKPLLGFFNGGPYAGASQPHLHIQFIPFVDGHPPGAERLAQATTDSVSPGQPTLLPTPHVHYITKLPVSPSPADLNSSYQQLLSLFRSGVATLPHSAQPSTLQKRDSYNLIFTTHHMHLVPRSSDAHFVPHPRSKAARKERAAKGNKDAKEEDVQEEMTFNGMTYAGIWFVGSEAERDDLVAYGCSEVLKGAGYARTERWPLKL